MKILKLVAIFAFVIFAFQITGCASLTEYELEEREYYRTEKLIKYQANYYLLVRQCRAQGGRVFMRPKTTRIRRAYTWEDYASAWCET